MASQIQQANNKKAEKMPVLPNEGSKMKALYGMHKDANRYHRSEIIGNTILTGKL